MFILLILVILRRNLYNFNIAIQIELPSLMSNEWLIFFFLNEDKIKDKNFVIGK